MVVLELTVEFATVLLELDWILTPWLDVEVALTPERVLLELEEI